MDVDEFIHRAEKIIVKADKISPFTRRLYWSQPLLEKPNETKLFPLLLSINMSSSTGIDVFLKDGKAVSSIVFQIPSDTSSKTLLDVENRIMGDLLQAGNDIAAGFCLAKNGDEPAFRFFFNQSTKVYVKSTNGKAVASTLELLQTGKPDDGKDLTCALSLSFPFITGAGKIFCGCDKIFFPERYLKRQIIGRGTGVKDKILSKVE
jgi:hypothetical protein